jgi:hypothetical protein
MDTVVLCFERVISMKIVNSDTLSGTWIVTEPIHLGCGVERVEKDYEINASHFDYL